MRNPVSRDGMGYRWDIPSDDVVLRVDRLHEQSETLTGELVIERSSAGEIYRSRVNLLAGQTLKSLAKALGSSRTGSGVDWDARLQAFASGAIRLEREGAPFELVGRAPVRPEVPALLRPMIYQGKPTILYGEGGLGKSTAIAAGAALSVATGVPMLDCWAVIEPGPVLILDWEAESGDWNDAIARISAARGIEAPLLHYRRMSGSLDSQVETIAAHVAHHRIVLIVIDSTSHALRTSDRTGPEDAVKRLFDALRIIGAASLLIDHRSKSSLANDIADSSSPIGSIMKVNNARATFELRQADHEDADGTRHLALINRKHNLARRPEPVGVAVRVVDTGDTHETRMWTEPVRLADAAVVTEARRSGALWKRAEEVLRVHGPMTVLSLVGHLGLEGKDPVAQIENAMRRKTTVFVCQGENRNTRVWSLGQRDPEDNVVPFPIQPEPETVPMFPASESVGERMARIMATAHPSPADDFGDLQ